MKKIILFICIAGLLFTACDDFGDMNDNPNAATDVSNNPELLLTGIIKDAVNQMVGTGWSEGALQAQYFARIVFTSFDQFEWGSNSGAWSQIYRSALDAQILNEIAVNTENQSYEAISLILKSWLFEILTDMWGDAPYSEALKAKTEVINYPAYDTQEDIYKGILNDLENANTLLASSTLSIKGDILYDGDLDKWQKFANSLHLRALLRLSEVDSKTDINVASELAKIIGDTTTYPVMSSSDESAALTYLSLLPNAHPISAASGYRSGSFDEYRMSETIEQVLEAYADPRQATWFAPTSKSADSTVQVWTGMINGMVDGDAYTYKGGSAYLSKINPDLFYYLPNGVKGLIMSASEVKFIIAEAAIRYPAVAAVADAQENYEAGIALNFDYWGVSMPADYLTRASVDTEFPVPVAYEGSIEQIITQKWLAMFYSDFQGFCEFKRTGYPRNIKPGPNTVLPNYPSRFVYPTNEQALNAANRDAAISHQGADEISTPVWWENK